MNGTPRRIEQRHPITGALIGTFTTTLTDAELAERDREAAERRDALLASNLSVMAEERRIEQVQREALAGISADVHARDHLRAAHQALTGARAELARRREVAEAAVRHVGRCQAADDAAQQVVASIAERAAAAIVEQLQQGEAPKTPTPTAHASREKAEAARADLEHAIVARDEVAGLVGPAEAAVSEAASQVKEAARGVIRLRVSELQAEIAALTAQLEERRVARDRLLPTLYERRWEVPWPTEAKALLHDPEAALDGPPPPAKVETAA
jgi:hypothetical protein